MLPARYLRFIASSSFTPNSGCAGQFSSIEKFLDGIDCCCSAGPGDRCGEWNLLWANRNAILSVAAILDSTRSRKFFHAFVGQVLAHRMRVKEHCLRNCGRSHELLIERSVFSGRVIGVEPLPYGLLRHCRIQWPLRLPAPGPLPPGGCRKRYAASSVRHDTCFSPVAASFQLVRCPDAYSTR